MSTVQRSKDKGIRWWNRFPRWLPPVVALGALLSAAWWLPSVDANARFDLEIGRAEAEAVARAFAKEKGFARLGEEGAATLRLQREEADELSRFYRWKKPSHPELVDTLRRLTPPMWVHVALTAENGDELEVEVGPIGDIVGFEYQALAGLDEEEEGDDAGEEIEENGEGEGSDEEPAEGEGREEDRRLAETALRERLGEELFEQLDIAGGEVQPQGTQTWLWHRSLQEIPDLELAFTVRVQRGQVVEEQLRADLDSAADPPFERGDGGKAILLLAWIGAAVLAVFAFAYGLWRYVDRLQESEVSHGRTALLGAGVGVMACLVIYYAAVNAGGFERIGINVPLPLALAVIFTIFFGVGLAIGVVWAGCEGDVRELYGDKLISLDALLSGRFLSRNVARAVLASLGFGALVIFLRGVALLPWAGDPSLGPGIAPVPFFVLHPWQHVVAKAFAVLILFVPLGVLVPLSVIRRWTRSRLRTVPILTAMGGLAFWINPATAMDTLPTLAGWAEASVWMVGFLAAFLVFDLLTALLSHGVALGLLHLLYFYHQPAPSLAVEAAFGTGVVAVGLLGALLIYRYGSELTAEEVRPGYARNMLERVALSAELSAARQAQTRMLPQEPPPVQGAILTSCCPSDWDSEGDYFDFFPLSDDRLALAVADFGRAGLAAALRMTLAKGFLLSYSWHGLEPAETARKLLRRLGELVTEEGEVSFAYGCFDPAASTLTLARGPRSPLVALLPAAGGEAQLLAGTEGEGEAPVKGEVQEVDLTPGDRLVFAHVEGVDWAAAKDRTRDRWLEILRRTRAQSAEELLKVIKNRGLSVGTVLVLRAETPSERQSSAPVPGANKGSKEAAA